MKDMIKEQILESIEVKKKVLNECVDDLAQVIDVLFKAFSNGNKLLICGNGGSAADSQHIAAEFVSTYRSDRRRPSIPAIALSTDTSMITAYSNDFGFEGIFARQVEGLGNNGDVLIGISTSGNSKNVIEAIKQAKEKGITTIGLLGNDGGTMKDLVDVSIIVPSQDTARIQEGHTLLYHIMCDLVDQKMYGNGNN